MYWFPMKLERAVIDHEAATLHLAGVAAAEEGGELRAVATLEVPVFYFSMLTCTSEVYLPCPWS